MEEKVYLEHLEKIWEANRPKGLPSEAYYKFGHVLVTTYLEERAKRTPNNTVIDYYGYEMSFKELDKRSSQFAACLSNLGLCKGDKVAVYMSNCPQFLIAFYGILKLGCVHVPVNPMFKQEELAYELNDAEVQVVVTTDKLIELVNKVKKRTKVKEVFTTSLAEYIPSNPSLPVHPTYLEKKVETNGSVDFLTIIQQFEPIYPNNNVSLDDIAALNYTGGTTGLPKGCIHTQRDMLYTAASACTFIFNLDENDIGLSYWPAFWIAGEILCILNPVISGAKHIMLGRWNAETALQAIDSKKITFINAGVDNIDEMLSLKDIKKYDLTSLKVTTATSLSKKLDKTYRNRWKQITGVTMVEATWGMTETHTYDTYTTGMEKDDMDLNSRPVFVGYPLPGTQFKIIDMTTGELLPLGVEGELAVITPSLFKGYWNKPEETSKAFRDGWFHTGDMALIDEEGYIHFLGRNKEMLKVNGMSVFPPEVEIILARHPAVSSNGIIGIPHEEKGEMPVALITLKDNYKNKITEEEIEAWCHENMAKYKVPIIKIVDELPMTATGKVLKIELQKRIQDILK